MKSQIPLWIGPRPQHPCWAFKRQVPLQPWQKAQPVEFPFERVWVILEGNSMLLSDGNKLPLAWVYTLDGKTLIGRSDPYQTSLDYSAEAKAFRAALDERNRAECGHLLDKGDA